MRALMSWMDGEKGSGAKLALKESKSKGRGPEERAGAKSNREELMEQREVRNCMEMNIGQKEFLPGGTEAGGAQRGQGGLPAAPRCEEQVPRAGARGLEAYH